jgi:beta-glucanase (GH16 family)
MTKLLKTGLAFALLALGAALAGGGTGATAPSGKVRAADIPGDDNPTSGSGRALAIANMAGNAPAFGRVLSVQMVSGPGRSSFVPSGYKKVFADEFDGPRLDTGKWWTRYIYNDGALDFLNDEQQRYREDRNHVMTGHSLTLVARKDGDGGYLSGMIRSKATFKYGYFEARIKIPAGVGVRPAFWLNSARRDSDGKIAWPPEIDIAEIANNGVEDTTSMLHVGLISHGAQDGKIRYADPEFHGDWSYWRAPATLAGNFHVLGALWDRDDTLSFFVDGYLIYKVAYKWVYDDGSPAGYANVILDLAIGGPQWAGRHGVDDAAFPQALEIDYVRVYQQPDYKRLGTDTVGKDLCPAQGEC